MSNTKKEKSQLTKIWNVVVSIVFVVLCIILLHTALALAKGGAPTFFGYSFMNVRTASMTPTIKQYDVILVKHVSSDEILELKAGDVVVYNTELDTAPGPVTHRIVETHFDDGYIVTKGDNNPLNDKHNPYLTEVVAVYVRTLPIMSFLYKILSSTYGFLFIILVPAFLLLIYSVVKIAQNSAKIQKAKSDVSEKERIEELKRKAVEEFLKSSPKTSVNEPSNGVLTGGGENSSVSSNVEISSLEGQISGGNDNCVDDSSGNSDEKPKIKEDYDF